jgi:hypothetical protein
MAAVQSRGHFIPSGAFAVATIGQAFHWMDRDAVLRKLAILITRIKHP